MSEVKKSSGMITRSRIIVIILIGAAFGLGAIVGVLGYLQATGGNSTPSQDVQDAVQRLSLNDPTPTPGQIAAVGTSMAELNTRVNSLATQVADQGNFLSGQLEAISTTIAAVELTAPTSDNTNAGPTTPPAEPTEAATSTEQDPDGETADGITRGLFRITEDESVARFLISEILNGEETIVEGISDQIAGDIIVNFADPAASQIGTIVVNARVIKTDQEYRDQSIRGQILESSRDEYELITFAPTAISGLPSEPAAIGETFEFSITGDLTIKDLTQPITFNATVTVESSERISGSASTETARADWGLTLNPPPFVADVGETVTLEINFIADLIEAA